MNCVKCSSLIKSKNDCIVAYEYIMAIFFTMPPELKTYHKNCFNEYKLNSSFPPAKIDLSQLNKYKDSSFKLLIFWIIIGIIPPAILTILLVQGFKFEEAGVILIFSIFPSSLLIFLYKSRLNTIKEIENLPSAVK